MRRCQISGVYIMAIYAYELNHALPLDTDSILNELKQSDRPLVIFLEIGLSDTEFFQKLNSKSDEGIMQLSKRSHYPNHAISICNTIVDIKNIGRATTILPADITCYGDITLSQNRMNREDHTKSFLDALSVIGYSQMDSHISVIRVSSIVDAGHNPEKSIEKELEYTAIHSMVTLRSTELRDEYALGQINKGIKSSGNTDFLIIMGGSHVQNISKKLIENGNTVHKILSRNKLENEYGEIILRFNKRTEQETETIGFDKTRLDRMAREFAVYTLTDNPSEERAMSSLERRMDNEVCPEIYQKLHAGNTEVLAELLQRSIIERVRIALMYKSPSEINVEPEKTEVSLMLYNKTEPIFGEQVKPKLTLKKVKEVLDGIGTSTIEIGTPEATMDRIIDICYSHFKQPIIELHRKEAHTSEFGTTSKNRLK